MVYPCGCLCKCCKNKHGVWTNCPKCEYRFRHTVSSCFFLCKQAFSCWTADRICEQLCYRACHQTHIVWLRCINVLNDSGHVIVVSSRSGSFLISMQPLVVIRAPTAVRSWKIGWVFKGMVQHLGKSACWLSCQELYEKIPLSCPCAKYRATTSSWPA